jgi:hypothetical protein
MHKMNVEGAPQLHKMMKSKLLSDIQSLCTYGLAAELLKVQRMHGANLLCHGGIDVLVGVQLLYSLEVIILNLFIFVFLEPVI